MNHLSWLALLLGIILTSINILDWFGKTEPDVIAEITISKFAFPSISLPESAKREKFIKLGFDENETSKILTNKQEILSYLNGYDLLNLAKLKSAGFANVKISNNGDKLARNIKLIVEEGVLIGKEINGTWPPEFDQLDNEINIDELRPDSNVSYVMWLNSDLTNLVTDSIKSKFKFSYEEGKGRVKIIKPVSSFWVEMSEAEFIFDILQILTVGLLSWILLSLGGFIFSKIKTSRPS